MRTILHIGLHRTGTTSVQAFFRRALPEVSFPVGATLPDVHLEASNVTLRPERMGSAARLRRDADLRRIREWAASARTAAVDLVISDESLSYALHDDEVENLLEALGPQERPVEVIVVLRDPASLLESHRTVVNIVRQSRLADEVVTVTLDDLHLDSWVVDYDALLAPWARRCTMHVLGYEDELARRGSIIPAVAEIVGLTPEEHWLNSSADLRESIATAMRERAAERRKAARRPD